MSYVAIIYTPENERRMPGLPFGMRGDRLFNYLIERPTPKKVAPGTIEKIEQDAVALRRGLNLVDADVWEAVLKHPTNVEAITRLSHPTISALIIFYPDNKEDKTQVAKDTTDFSDLNIVQQLIINATDVNWLTLCLNRDRRIEVGQSISERLQELAEEENVRRQQMVGAMTAMR